VDDQVTRQVRQQVDESRPEKGSRMSNKKYPQPIPEVKYGQYLFDSNTRALHWHADPTLCLSENEQYLANRAADIYFKVNLKYQPNFRSDEH
jgi:hypothetical protein